ncbi:MAG TPA: hypothetical protein GX010_04925 [Erysipelotrichaceae bacterium]|nr:hypothetical protein [Erysipelotrichaceae bacterium]
MKKTKIVIPALGLLLLSTAASVTGTVAWFAMNSQVTATGMKVTAKSDSTFLVISSTSSLGSATSLDLSGVQGTLLPVSYTTSAIGSEVEANNWYKAVGTSTTDGSAAAGTTAQLTITEDANLGSVSGKHYYVYSSFYVGLAAGSSAVETNKGIQADVKFTATAGSNLNKCLTTKIVYGGGNPSSAPTTQTYVFNDAGTAAVTKYSTALQADDLITTTATPVKVYIYFDGNNVNCTTANAINLNGITVDITFTVNELLHS